MKIIELTIDNLEDFGGLDAISIVERPAHESNFLAFNDEYKPIFEMLGDEEMTNLAFQVSQLGEDHQQMLDDGYVLFAIQDAVPEKEVFFTPPSNPNPPNEQEFNPRVRYKYTGEIRENTREFCRIMVGANRIYTAEDIQELSALNPVGPSNYDVLQWRGSYNCLHKWVKLTYVPKAEMEKIRNNPASVRGLISQEVGVLYDTRNDKTKAAEAEGRSKGVNIGPRVGGWAMNEEFNVIDIVDEMPLFSTKEEALLLAERIGCSGFHIHNREDGSVGYMACDKHEFESYDDYPKEASENACKVLRWIDEHGRDEVEGMTQTGLARANQLCKGENISEDTIGRMAAFERHRKNSKINPEFKGTPWKDKGYVSWLGWGGDAGIEWAQRKLEQIARDLSNEDMLDENPCQTGYVAYGTKMKDGKEVPNCVPENQSKFSFSNDEKMEIVGPALIPNKMIIRRSAPTILNPNGEFYYVFFNEETIAKLSEKFMLEKRLDQTNIEHSDKEADSYVKESWIISDPENDKSNAYGMTYPKGTWMITMKVKNKQIWDDIKSGKLNGYSVEGWFNENLLFQ